MREKLLKDIFIQKGKVDCYFGNEVPVSLWRALKKKSNNGIFDFIEEATILSNGRPRAADIKIYEHKNGEKWVSVEDRPRGLSTFDKEGCPPGNGWEYYKILAGTILPEELAIVKDQYNKRYDATHYTIAPAYDMSLVQFKPALATFAAELFKKAV